MQQDFLLLFQIRLELQFFFAIPAVGRQNLKSVFILLYFLELDHWAIPQAAGLVVGQEQEILSVSILKGHLLNEEDFSELDLLSTFGGISWVQWVVDFHFLFKVDQFNSNRVQDCHATICSSLELLARDVFQQPNVDHLVVS
jgi:hypothetical protein